MQGEVFMVGLDWVAVTITQGLWANDVGKHDVWMQKDIALVAEAPETEECALVETLGRQSLYPPTRTAKRVLRMVGQRCARLFDCPARVDSRPGDETDNFYRL
jgi:hypothetical protein